MAATDKLTDPAIRNAKPKDKPYKMPDGGGLFVSIQPSGSKWWRLKYRFDGKEKLLSVGVYPDTGLKLARSKRDEARSDLANGIDPGAKRKAEKSSRAEAVTNSFEAVAREWHSTVHTAKVSDGHALVR